MVTIVALKFAMGSHFPLAKKIRSLSSDSQVAAIVLPIENMNQINSKNYWK